MTMNIKNILGFLIYLVIALGVWKVGVVLCIWHIYFGLHLHINRQSSRLIMLPKKIINMYCKDMDMLP